MFGWSRLFMYRLVWWKRSVFPGIAELYSASLGFLRIFAEYNSAIPDCPKRIGTELNSPASKVRGAASLDLKIYLEIIGKVINPMSKIFISHASADTPTALAIAK
uniref:Uncharacterized protein n=1 Tax=Candidatus Kentrum sp. FW TaxID=2126338 RepID=A0A450T9C4_9GAMM|nr:MAG: hypothetical protein BECKFW1821B_GA0114236_108113 [Candidatus Kentron sp. FW]